MLSQLPKSLRLAILVAGILAIVIVLLLPQIDLDPVTLRAFALAVAALCIIRGLLRSCFMRLRVKMGSFFPRPDVLPPPCDISLSICVIRC